MADVLAMLRTPPSLCAVRGRRGCAWLLSGSTPSTLPPPAGARRVPCGVDTDYRARCKKNRSAATLLLAWVRYELLDQLRTCPLLGRPLRFRHVDAEQRDPLAASLACHLWH